MELQHIPLWLVTVMWLAFFVSIGWAGVFIGVLWVVPKLMQRIPTERSYRLLLVTFMSFAAIFVIILFFRK